ncbi:hypothetical protein EV714DRAFT_217675, partial [Schizophyllum commune]
PETCFDSLCSNLDLSDLVHLSRANKRSLQKVKMYSRIAFQPHRALQNFFRASCVEGLLHVMSRTGTIISGRAALLFFTRDILMDCALNLYTERHHAEEVFRFLSEHSYAYCARDGQNDDLAQAFSDASSVGNRILDIDHINNTVIDTFSFNRSVPDNTVSTVIRVTVVRFCAIHTVLSFHTTALMNIITHRAAYSLYPRATFLHKVGISFVSSESEVSTDMRLGPEWTMRSSLTHVDLNKTAFGGEFATFWRYIGGSQTWTINFTERRARTFER